MAVSPELCKECQQAGMQVCNSPQGKVNYWEVGGVEILLGNEGAGLSAELAALADLKLEFR